MALAQFGFTPRLCDCVREFGRTGKPHNSEIVYQEGGCCNYAKSLPGTAVGLNCSFYAWVIQASRESGSIPHARFDCEARPWLYTNRVLLVEEAIMHGLELSSTCGALRRLSGFERALMNWEVTINYSDIRRVLSTYHA